MSLLNAVDDESPLPHIRTYLDSSTLIGIVRGPDPVSERAIEVLNDARRFMLSSQLVRLETLPKAIFHRQENEISVYQRFFDDVVQFAPITATLIDDAFDLATRWNLSGFDAIHFAAAIQLNADELITSERPTSPLCRVQEQGLTIVSLRAEPDPE